MLSINYEEQIAHVLEAFYDTEENFRFENYKDGFVFSRLVNPRFFSGGPDNEVDWLVRFTGRTVDEVCEQMATYHVTEEPDSYLSRWLQRKPTFMASYVDGNHQVQKKELPITYKPISFEQVKFGKLLVKLNHTGFFYRIESLWDSGYTISIIDPSVCRPNVEIDEMNVGQHPGLNVSNKDFSDLVYLPEKDWVYQTEVRYLTHANDWLELVLTFYRQQRFKSVERAVERLRYYATGSLGFIQLQQFEALMQELLEVNKPAETDWLKEIRGI